MGRKQRAYCPYCDVYLVHNSLRSRRDHNEGWKHIAAFQAYYSRFASQASQQMNNTQTPEVLHTVIPTPTPVTPPSIPNHPPTIRPPVIAPPSIPIQPPKIGPPTIQAPPQITPPTVKPPAIRPPKITAPSGPPAIRAPPAIRSGPPSISKN